jgi:hypothetical protein
MVSVSLEKKLGRFGRYNITGRRIPLYHEPARTTWLREMLCMPAYKVSHILVDNVPSCLDVVALVILPS